MISSNSYVYWTLTGVLLGVGFVWPWLWWCAIIGVSACWHLLSQQNGQRRYTGLYLVWTIKSLFAISWFFSVYPLTWLGFEPGIMQLVVIGFYWVTVGLTLGTGGLLLAAVWPYLIQLKNLHLLVLGYLIMWVGGELLGSLVFSLWNLGPGSGVNLSFSVGYLGYLAAQHPLLFPLATIGGVYALTAVTVWIGWWVGRLQRDRPLIGSLLVVLVVLTSVLPETTSELTHKTQTVVGVLDTSFTYDQYTTDAGVEARQTALRTAFSAASTTYLDYIVLPEDTRLFDTSVSPNQATAIVRFLYSLSSSTIVVDSGRKESATGNTLQALIYDPVTFSTHLATKQFLVPQGEYLPYSYAFFLRLFGLQNLAEQYNAKRAYVRGPASAELFPANIPAVLFCFESVDPRGVKRLLHQHTNTPFIVHPVSHAWFNESDVLAHQLDTMLRVQATWNEVAIISAGNQARGKLYLPDGTIDYGETVTSGDHWHLRQFMVSVR